MFSGAANKNQTYRIALITCSRAKCGSFFEEDMATLGYICIFGVKKINSHA